MLRVLGPIDLQAIDTREFDFRRAAIANLNIVHKPCASLEANDIPIGKLGGQVVVASSVLGRIRLEIDDREWRTGASELSSQAVVLPVEEMQQQHFNCKVFFTPRARFTAPARASWPHAGCTTDEHVLPPYYHKSLDT